MVEIRVPTRADPPITFHGYAIRAPGFTAETFAAGIARALSDGLTVQPGRAPKTFLVTNPTNRSEYAANVHGCSCRAGELARPCKHRSIILLVEAITGGADRLGGAS